MDGTHRQPASDLISTLETDSTEFSFFRAVELLLQDSGNDIEERALYTQEAENILFRVDPGLGFPSGDIADVSRIEAEDGSEATVLTVNFLGLHGSSSPLPSHMLEAAAWSQDEEGIQQSFNDFFSNRLIWLFYLTWRKYRYYIRYQPDAQDQFSDWMFSLIGFGGRDARSATDIPWAKLLTYLGVISARTRSAEMISGVIAHAFALPKVSIRQLENRIVEIPDNQRACMGSENMTLGKDMTIGRFVRDVAGKFTIVLEDLSFDRFRDFLPSGRDYPRMKELVEFLLKDQLAYDLELHFKHKQTPEFVLGRDKRADLGWTTFVGETRQGGLEPVVLQVRA